MARCLSALRLFVVVSLMLCVTQGRPGSGRATSMTPSVGQWGFCTSASQIGCIESVRASNDAQQTVTAMSSAELSALSGLTVSVTCSSFSTNQSECDSHAATPNSPMSVGMCGFGRPAELTIVAHWSGKADRSISVKVRTGDFDPVYSYGNGVSSTVRVANTDGSFSYEWNGFIDEIKTSSIPSSITTPPLPSNYKQLLENYFATAVIDGQIETSTVRVLPAAYFHVAAPRVKVNGKWEYECVDLPMKGIWAESNAQMFSYGFTFNGKSAKTSSQFSFEATSPHFLPGGVSLNPARFKMFIPDSYVTSIGYTADTFSVAALKLSTKDGQSASPVLTRADSGFNLDFGIQHYSTPDPVVQIYNNNWSEPVEAVVPAASPAVAYSPPVDTTPRRPVVAGKNVSLAQILASAGVKRPKGSSIAMYIVKGKTVCTSSSTRVATRRTGTCRVRVSVSSKGKVISTQYVLLVVSKK